MIKLVVYFLAKDLEEQGDVIDEALEESFYLRRLDAGLFTLQLIVCVMMEGCSSGVASVGTYFFCSISTDRVCNALRCINSQTN